MIIKNKSIVSYIINYLSTVNLEPSLQCSLLIKHTLISFLLFYNVLFILLTTVLAI